MKSIKELDKIDKESIANEITSSFDMFRLLIYRIIAKLKGEK